MKKVIYKIILTIFLVGIIILLNKTISNAATANISATSQNVKVGDNVNINVSCSAATWNLKVSGAGISDTIVGVDMDVTNKSTSKSYKLNTSNPGTYTVSLSGDITDANGTSKNISNSVTVKVSEKTSTNNNTSTNNTEQPQEPTFTGTNQTVYATGDINVRSSYSTSSSAVGSLKKGDSVTRTGIGSNGWSKVTFNGKTAYISSSLLTTTKPKEEEKSTNKALESLTIEQAVLDPEFNKDTTNYSITVGENIDTLKINAIPEDEKAKVTISGNENLQKGTNTVKVLVTAEDGTVRTYTIIVNKQEGASLGLSSLNINGASLNENFETGVYEYTVNLNGNEDLTKLDITAKANKEDATIEIIGNENLVIGENVITIIVKSKDGKENVTYQILVNKSEKTSEIANTNNKIANNSNKTFLYVSIAIFVVALILIILIIVRSIKKSREEDEDDVENAYGFKYDENNNITEELYGIRNKNELHEEEIPTEVTKTKLYDVEKEVDFSEDEEKRPRRKGKHSK